MRERARSPQATTLPRRRATSSGAHATTTSARGPRGARASSCGGSRRDQGDAAPADRERHPPSCARRRAGPGAGPRGDRHPDEHRDGAADHARARRQRSVARRHRNRLPRPPADAVVVPCRLRPRLHRRRRRRCRRAPHRRRRARRLRHGAPAGARQPGGSRALRLRDRADGRGAGHARRSTSCGAHTPRSRLRSPASASAVWRSRCCRMRSSGSRWRPAAPSTWSRPALDDHHVAEAAFKALGQALRQAVAPGDGGIRSTKGIA